MRLYTVCDGEGVRHVLAESDAKYFDISDFLISLIGSLFGVKEKGISLDVIFQSPRPTELLDIIKDKLSLFPSVNLEDFVVEPPLFHGNMICVGRNYAAHASELGNEIPAEPILFMKPSLSRIGSGQDIIYWDDASSLHFEGELALVIGEDLSGTISEIEARRAIIGLTLLNDVTDRVKQTELKNSGKPWLVAKGRPTFAPIGPSIYLLPEDAEINKLTYTTSLNGTEVQHGDTSLWLWEAESIVATIARLVGLKSGDIIATGTPSGVGQLSSGDEITIHSELLGQLTNFVKTEK